MQIAHAMQESTPSVGHTIEEPIFIASTTRSGSTLLSLMLGHHPDIAHIGELEWIWDFPGAEEAASLESYHAWLSTHRFFLWHRLQADRSLAFADLARSMLEQMRLAADPARARPHVVCQLHRHYARALALWPKARFIHLVRDGRDVCASWLRLGWVGSGYRAGLDWRAEFDAWEAIAPRIASERRFELHFEDLTRSPEHALGRLCDFIGVPYAQSMLRYHDNSPYEPVDPFQGGKWRSALRSRDLRLFEAVAGKVLAARGYVLSGERPLRLRAWSAPWLHAENMLRHHLARARVYGPRLWLADILARRVGTRAWRARVRLALNRVENARLK